MHAVIRRSDAEFLFYLDTVKTRVLRQFIQLLLPFFNQFHGKQSFFPSSIGYNLTYRGQPLRVFGTVQNAFTLTGYSGVDPTAGLNGLDNNIYPRSRTFAAGLNVRF